LERALRARAPKSALVLPRLDRAALARTQPERRLAAAHVRRVRREPALARALARRPRSACQLRGRSSPAGARSGVAARYELEAALDLGRPHANHARPRGVAATQRYRARERTMNSMGTDGPPA